MTRFYKSAFLIAAITCLPVAMISLSTTRTKHSIASLVEQTRYAVIEIHDKTSHTNSIAPNVAHELAEIIRYDSSMLIIGKKSVCYGDISLFDGDMKPLARVGVLKHPLFQFQTSMNGYGDQLELQCDLVGSLGFNIRGYDCRP